MKPLNGDHNQCTGCGRYFNSTGAFDKHRTGKYGVDRRCKTEEEMIASGMSLNSNGFWIGSKMKGYKEHEVKGNKASDTTAPH
jgi:hypothetical protein